MFCIVSHFHLYTQSHFILKCDSNPHILTPSDFHLFNYYYYYVTQNKYTHSNLYNDNNTQVDWITNQFANSLEKNFFSLSAEKKEIKNLLFIA